MSENAPAPTPKPAETPRVVKVEEYRTPIKQAYPTEASRGRARRLRFRGAWTSDGKYHDID
jgi:hypothetical protein